MNSLINKPNVYFRVDFGGLIGRGHLSRCYSVAEIFKKNNFNPVFIIRKRPCTGDEIIPFDVMWLPEGIDAPSAEVTSWIIGSQLEEASLTNSLIEEKSLVIIDHYGLDITYQKELKAKGHKVVLFQDLYEEKIAADILVNYDLNAEGLYSHAFKVSQPTKFLLGPKYTPLSSAYQNEHRLRFSLNTKVETVGIYLGGVEMKYLTLVAHLIKNFAYFKDKKIEWVVNSVEEKSILENILGINKITIHIRLPNLISLYDRTQLFLGTCGVAFLERACMGIWQINFIAAYNQLPLGEFLINSNISNSIINLLDATPDVVENEFSQFINEVPAKILSSIQELNRLITPNGAIEIYKGIIS